MYKERDKADSEGDRVWGGVRNGDNKETKAAMGPNFFEVAYRKLISGPKTHFCLQKSPSPEGGIVMWVGRV